MNFWSELKSLVRRSTNKQTNKQSNSEWLNYTRNWIKIQSEEVNEKSWAMRVRFFFFFYLWLSCRYLWKVLVPCSSLRRDSRERERKREGCAENVYIYSWCGVGLKWGYREEKGFCFVYLGSGHECWVSVRARLVCVFKNWKLLFKNICENTCGWKSVLKYVKHCLKTKNCCLKT